MTNIIAFTFEEQNRINAYVCTDSQVTNSNYKKPVQKLYLRGRTEDSAHHLGRGNLIACTGFYNPIEPTMTELSKMADITQPESIAKELILITRRFGLRKSKKMMYCYTMSLELKGIMQ